jgi:hypothetical protein
MCAPCPLPPILPPQRSVLTSHATAQALHERYRWQENSNRTNNFSGRPPTALAFGGAAVRGLPEAGQDQVQGQVAAAFRRAGPEREAGVVAGDRLLPAESQGAVAPQLGAGLIA